MTADQHLWTVADRRAQLGELRKIAKDIKKRYRTDAYDEIIAACDEFLTKGFTEERLKAFSRQTGTPPGWVHPRSDQRSQMEQDDPALVGKLTRARDLIETLRTIGRWAD